MPINLAMLGLNGVGAAVGDHSGQYSCPALCTPNLLNADMNFAPLTSFLILLLRRLIGLQDPFGNRYRSVNFIGFFHH